MTKRRNPSAAAKALKARREMEADRPVRLSTGHWVLIRPVSASLITDSQAEIKEPPVPMWYNEDKEREEPNPNDPAYVAALNEVNGEKILAAVDAAILTGIVVVDRDGVTIEADPNGIWLRQLKLMAKIGRGVRLEPFDLSDPVDLDFLWKKYFVVSASDIPVILSRSGLTEEDIEAARATFRDQA